MFLIVRQMPSAKSVAEVQIKKKWKRFFVWELNIAVVRCFLKVFSSKFRENVMYILWEHLFPVSLSRPSTCRPWGPRWWRLPGYKARPHSSKRDVSPSTFGWICYWHTIRSERGRDPHAGEAAWGSRLEGVWREPETFAGGGSGPRSLYFLFFSFPLPTNVVVQ